MKPKSHQPEVLFSARGLTVQAELEETLLSCIRRAGLSVESTCNGRGVCGKCRVTAQGALTAADDKEREHLVGQPEDVRLACMARVLGKVRVTLSDDWQRLKTVADKQNRIIPVKSPIKRIPFTKIEPANAYSYAEVPSIRTVDPQVLNTIATWDWKNSPAFGLVYRRDLLDVVSDRKPLLGAAVDVGTTSLSLSLFDLERGVLLGRSAGLNPQTAYGGDVITRIAYCHREENGLFTLRSVLTEKLGHMMDEALGPDRSRDQVYLMTVAGNTTMLHILAGVHPFSLAMAPYRPTFLRSLVLSGEESGLPIHPRGRAVLLPGVSAYIGADIVAGLAAIDYRSLGGVTLFIDMGTNGELVLIQNSDRMMAASCAMGPALEGMNISCGCRAVPGAIDSFALDEDLVPQFTTIDGLLPVGICGSGLIDLVASLYEAGLILPGGAFNHDADKRLKDRLSGDRYHLTENVFLSQHDIRQVQLAKGAMTAGILTLLEEAGLRIGDMTQIVVAGAFGYYVNPDNLKRIGLLPHDYKGPVSFVGNSSLTGASFALLNNRMMKEIEKIPTRVRAVELSSHAGFSSRFVASLNFPNYGEMR